MNTFQEFYEDKQVEVAFQEVLSEFFLPSAAAAGGVLTTTAAKSYADDKIKETIRDKFLEALLPVVVTAASVFFGAKLLGKGINYILKKNREALEKANDKIDFEKDFEKSIKLAEIEEKGKDLSDEEIEDLKDKLSKQLAEKYPSKEQGWWLKVLDKAASFMKSNPGAFLASFAAIYLI